MLACPRSQAHPEIAVQGCAFGLAYRPSRCTNVNATMRRVASISAHDGGWLLTSAQFFRSHNFVSKSSNSSRDAKSMMTASLEETTCPTTRSLKSHLPRGLRDIFQTRSKKNIHFCDIERLNFHDWNPAGRSRRLINDMRHACRRG